MISWPPNDDQSTLPSHVNNIQADINIVIRGPAGRDCQVQLYIVDCSMSASDVRNQRWAYPHAGCGRSIPNTSLAFKEGTPRSSSLLFSSLFLQPTRTTSHLVSTHQLSKYPSNEQRFFSSKMTYWIEFTTMTLVFLRTWEGIIQPRLARFWGWLRGA